LLRYLTEIRFQVLAAIYPRFTHESGTIRKKQAIDVSKLKRLLCYESQHQSLSNEKSLVQFDYEKAVSNYLGTQSTFNPIYMYYYKSRRGEHLCARAIQISTETEVAKLSTTAIHFHGVFAMFMWTSGRRGFVGVRFSKRDDREASWKLEIYISSWLLYVWFLFSAYARLCALHCQGQGVRTAYIYIYIYTSLYIDRLIDR